MASSDSRHHFRKLSKDQCNIGGLDWPHQYRVSRRRSISERTLFDTAVLPVLQQSIEKIRDIH
jgi:hypothetical protein